MSEPAGRPLLTVPNFSEGRDVEVVGSLAETMAGHATVLDTHHDDQHNRCVITAAGGPQELTVALANAAELAIELIDMRAHQGLHPHIGALDVCPVVWMTEAERETARATALEVAEAIAGLGVPVFLYADLATAPERRERAFFRKGGQAALSRRLDSGELTPDLGPAELHPSAGATLVAARAPLVAFNVELNTPNPEIARTVAAQLRESGGGLKGVRAIGLPREGGTTQVSTNVEDPFAIPLARVLDEVRGLAEMHGVMPIAAELVGLVPEAALQGYPAAEFPFPGFEPDRDIVERRLAALRG